MKNYPGENYLSDQSARSELWAILTQVDADLAEQARLKGCQRCGGVLHRGNYARKVCGMGMVEATRDSFCCATDDCRRRTTPASVRFLGRRVYAGFVVVLLAALRHGLSAQRVQVLRERLGVDQRTLQRWRSWWLEQFAGGRLWREGRGRLMPPIDEAALPASLWERFYAHRGPPPQQEDPLVKLLRFLTPWSTRAVASN